MINRNERHKLLCNDLKHTQEHGDSNLLLNILLKTGINDQAKVILWIEKFAPLKVIIGKLSIEKII